MPRDIAKKDDALKVRESRDFRSFHGFLRASRVFLDGPLIEKIEAAYARQFDIPKPRDGAAPRLIEDVLPFFDNLPQFQLYQWMYRHLQQFKYSRNDLGIVATVDRDRRRLEGQIEETWEHSQGTLCLNPDLVLPDYYRMVDFHQQPGGVWSDSLAGLVYEMGRRTTVPQHADPNAVYHILFDALPRDKTYDHVLDWGTGVGSGLIEWQKAHPHSRAYGVDLSAPCLKLARLRAQEAGVTLHLSQQDLARLDFDSDFFDLVFHLFMFHELPATQLGPILEEAARVIKPGGIMFGPEFHLTPNDLLQNVLQTSHAWTNNETYSADWFKAPIKQLALQAGFSKVDIVPFNEEMAGLGRKGAGEAPRSGCWNLYVFEK